MWIALDWKLHFFVKLHWIALDNEKRVTGSVVTGKVVKLDWIALTGLRCIPHWRCFEWLDCLG